MKRCLLLLGVLLTCGNASLPVLAQGRIRFANDSLHLIYFTSNTSLLRPADVALAGQVVPAGGVTPSGAQFMADLWGGTSASELVLLTHTTLGTLGPGTLTPVNLVTSFPAGVPAFFQVQVYDTRAGSYLAALNSWWLYCGESPIFTTVPGSSLPFNSIVRSGSPAFSTWAPGTWPLDAAGYGPGALGAISLQIGPEPSPGALLVLGVVIFLLRRRFWTVEPREAYGVRRLPPLSVGQSIP